MEIWKCMFLGLVQGLTEFLPVSSSGHIVLLKHYLNYHESYPILVEVTLHLGTLLAIFFVYSKKIFELVKYLFTEAPGRMFRSGFSSAMWGDTRGKMIVLLIVGSIPSAIFGYFFRDLFEGLFSNVPATSAALIITGTLLYSTRFIPEKIKGKRSLGARMAFIIGTIQGLAITPGISRSGSTISAGMWGGLDRERAADFSFLLSIPSIIGATVFVLGRNGSLPFREIPVLIPGFIVSFITGYIALKLLLGFIRRGKFHIFAWYCWILGLVSLVAFIA